jgi:hypothetical protein
VGHTLPMDAIPAVPSLHRPGQTCREAGTQSQGSSDPVPKTARPPVAIDAAWRYEVQTVKANLARFTSSPAINWLQARYGVVLVLVVLASLALTLGAGQKWD